MQLWKTQHCGNDGWWTHSGVSQQIGVQPKRLGVSPGPGQLSSDSLLYGGTCKQCGHFAGSPLTLRSSSMARSFTRSSSMVASLWLGPQASFSW